MLTLHNPKEVQQWRRTPEINRRRVGFVPTMGALHEGHMALVHEARRECDVVAVSIFVNPLQFGPKEDLAAYPRALERDTTMLEEAKVDALYLPETQTMYDASFSTQVSEEHFSKGMCGEFRPGHFRGVATVVLKLFNIVRPDIAYFGQKDLQQFKVIEKMTRDLNLDIALAMCPIVRAVDGLALSSRNTNLSASERRSAPLLYKALQSMQTQWSAGERDASRLKQGGERMISGDPAFKLQYLEIRRLGDFAPLERMPDKKGEAFIAVAAFLGKTRLIDNIII